VQPCTSTGVLSVIATKFTGVQEYERINRLVLDFMVHMGSESATVSDAERAWLQIQQHFNNLNSGTDFRRIASTPAADLQ
jgi:hypothetical protein